MGGRGSGRPASFGLFVDKCEDYLSIDITWMHRRKMLEPGQTGSLRWSRNEQQIAWIRYSVQTDGILLIYKTRSGEGDWRSVRDLIPFTWTNTNFGGRRQWFVCPGCRKPCRLIYGGSLFRCRKCHGLKYESQYEPSYSRACTQRHELRKRLGQVGSLDDPFPPKPKGMHWSTYEQLEARDDELQQRWARDVMDWLERTKPD